MVVVEMAAILWVLLVVVRIVLLVVALVPSLQVGAVAVIPVARALLVSSEWEEVRVVLEEAVEVVVATTVVVVQHMQVVAEDPAILSILC